LRVFALCVLAGSLLACAPQGEPPELVAGRFWEALRRGDVDTARSLATATSAEVVASVAGDRPIESVVLGETLKSDESAVVRTEIVTLAESREVRTAFETHLVREERGWKVDARATRRDLTTAVFSAAMTRVGEAVEAGMQELGDALEQGAADLARAIREATEGLDASPP